MNDVSPPTRAPQANASSARSAQATQKLLVTLFVVLFASGGVLYTLGAAVGSALFISSLPLAAVPRTLPWVYVGASVAHVASALLYDRMSARMSRVTALLVTQVSLGLLFGLAMALWVEERPLHYYLLTVGLDAASLLSITLFFGFAGDYFSAADARRLYGWLAGGLAVGTVLGGYALSSLIPLLGVPRLVYLCAALLLVNACLSVSIARVGPPLPVPGPAAQAAPEVSLRVLLANRFVRLIWLTFPLGMLLTVASAFQMQWLASQKPRAELAGFLGDFYAWVGAGELLFQLLAVPLILRKLGVIGALMLPPVLVGLASGTMQYASLLNYAGGSPIGYSAAVNGVRLTLEETLSLPARELLFLPLPARLRSRAQTWAGAVLAPLTRGLAGLLLLGCVGAGFGVEALSSVVIVCSFLLLLTFLRMRKSYRQALFESLRATRLGSTDLARLTETPGADAVLGELLGSRDPNVVLFTLQLLGDQRLPSLIPRVQALAAGQGETAARALAFLGAQGDVAQAPLLQAALESPSEQVACAAALALGRLTGEQACEQLLPLLDTPRAKLAESALEVLARHERTAGEVRARLAALLGAPERSERLRAIALTARIARPPYGALLANLVRSSDWQVRCAAASAATRAGTLELIPVLLERVQHGELAPAAFGRLGPRVIGPVAQALAGPLTATARRYLLRSLAECPHPDTLALLGSEVEGMNDLRTRATAAECLWSLAQREPPSEQSLEPFVQVIEQECAAVECLLDAQRALAAHAADIAALFGDHASLRLDVVLSLCGLYMAHDEFERMRRSLSSGSSALGAAAVELLDAALPRRLADRVSRVLNASLVGLSERAAPTAAAAGEGKGLSLLQLDALARLGSWPSASVALYAKRQGQEPARWLRDPDAWTAFERLPDVLFLKQVSLFQGLLADDLYELARLATPVSVPTHGRVFEQGEEGDALYLVSEGCVSVQVEGREVARLLAGEPLGELALLDGEPRSASAMAAVPTRLLRLSVAAFQALLHAEPRLRSALLRTLYTRLGGLRSSGLPGAPTSSPSVLPRPALGLGDLVSALSILREAELFDGLSQDELLKLAACAHPVSHFAGEVVYRAGGPAEAFYIVCSGMVSLSSAGTEVARIERGSCFGEAAVIGRETRRHGAHVVQDAQLLRFRAAEFQHWLDAEPEIGAAMLRHFAARLRAGTVQRMAE